MYRDLACQGWHGLWPSLTRDGNCHLLQAAHQNTLLPGTSIGSNQLASGHHATPADGQKGWGAARVVPSRRCITWRWRGLDFQLRMCQSDPLYLRFIAQELKGDEVYSLAYTELSGVCSAGRKQGTWNPSDYCAFDFKGLRWNVGKH